VKEQKFGSVQIQSLLVIDDNPIRKESFRDAEKIIRKIDRLDDKIINFNSSDQRLFNNWFEMTFRDEREKIEVLHSEYRELGIFHNWIIATAKMLDVSLPHAYRLMKDEEKAYAAGAQEVKRRIEREREVRDKYIREEIEREFGFSGDEDIFGDHFDSELEDEEELTYPSRSPEQELFMERFSEMPEKKIHKICKDQDSAFELLALVLDLGPGIEVTKLFLRIWDQVPHKHQTQFARDFSQQTKTSLAALIEEMRKTVALGEMTGDDGDDDGNDDEMDERFFDSSEARFETPKLNPFEIEKLKLIYRKLVRRLHPDMQGLVGGRFQTRWQKKVWDDAQLAHKRLDVFELERLYRYTLLRQNELHDLTISEIRESQNWLQLEILKLEFEAKKLRKLPAWGFSRKKSLVSLTKRIKNGFDRDLDHIEGQLNELKEQHMYLEMRSLQTEPTRRKSKRSHGHKSGSPREDFRQRSFFEDW